MREKRLFEYQGHWLLERSDTPNLHIYWCKPGTRRVCRKSTGTADLERARQRLIEFVNEQSRPQEELPENVSLHDALNEYVEVTLAGRPSQDNARGFYRQLNRFFEREGLRFVSDLTYDAQGAYIAWRRQEAARQGRTLSNGTVSRELDVVKAALRQFHRRGLLKDVPYIRSLPAPPPRDRFLTPDECQRLLDACHEPHLQLFVLISLHTLQRPSAVLDLQCSQVDVARKRVHFLAPGETQSNKRRPTVPISDTLLQPLTAALDASESGFVIEYQGRRVRSIKKAFKTACQRARLERVIPYTLRHTGATLLAAAGVPMRQIAGMLGHSQLHTTERYAKHAPDFLRQASAALDGMFGQSST